MKPFLTTEWTHLAMLNYEVDPSILADLVPRGTELDDFDGRHFVSMVGFLYRRTRIRGFAFPWHQNFAEVNLRFYVRYRAREGWRRGVAFVKEIVPRRAVALIARRLYDENFVTHPMQSRIEISGTPPTTRVCYEWLLNRTWQQLEVAVSGEAKLPDFGSEAEFITEHYWGYTARRDGTTSEYRVEHVPWRVNEAIACELKCDATTLYGEAFAEALGKGPSSAFLAEGSPVAVYPGTRLNTREACELHS